MPEPTKKAGPLTTEPADTHEHKYTDAKEIEQAFSDFVRDNSFTEVSAGVFRGLDPLTGHALKVDTLAHIIRDLVNGEAWTEDAIDDEGKPAAFFASRAAKPAAAPAPKTTKARAAAARPRPPVAFLDNNRELSPELLDGGREFLKAPSNALGARLVAKILNSDEPETLIAEKTALSGRADFYILNGVEHAPFDTIKKAIVQILEKVVKIALESLEVETEGAKIKDLYSAAGKARHKARSTDFINGVLPLLADEVLISGGIPWNASPECIPTSKGVADFSGPELIVRDRRPGEYFRHVVPCTAEEIVNASRSEKFERYLETLFHDTDTRRSARECLALCISGHPTKNVQIWTNLEGDGGKTTLFDLIRDLIPGRIITGENAVILYKADPSARRFGVIRFQGALCPGFEEPSGTFDVCKLKELSGLGVLLAEAKGTNPVEFPQTWGAIVIKCNELPRFFPANDGGFLSRIFVLVFSTIFYADDASYKRRLDEGVSPARLKPAGDKAQILADLLTERPAIIATLARTWIEVRARGGKPYESPECTRAKEAYRTANDTAQLFFSAYFIRDDYGTVDYSTVKESWAEFSGEAKPSMRDVVAMLVRRYPFITPARSHGARRLKGIALKTENDPGDSGDPITDFQARERENQEKDIRSEKNGSGSPESPELFRDDIETPAPQSLEPIETALSEPSEPEPVQASEDPAITQARAILKTYTLEPNVREYLEGIISGARELTEPARQIIALTIEATK